MTKRLALVLIFVLFSADCGKGLHLGEETASSTNTITFTPSFPTLSHKYYANPYSTAERTVTFSHDGDSVECSSDGGATFGACTTMTTLVWAGSAYSTAHVIRVTKAGADNSPYDYTFTPSSQFSGKVFLDCDDTVAANEDFDAFEARLGTANKVVCIAPGVTISNTTDRITIGANGIKIIGDYDDSTLEFDNTVTAGAGADDRSGIYATGKTNLVLAGVSIEVDGASAKGLEFTNSDGYYVEFVKIESNGASSRAFYSTASDGTLSYCTLNADAANSITARIIGPSTNTLSHTTVTSTAAMYGLELDSGTTATIDSCTLSNTAGSSLEVLYSDGPTNVITITGSTITNPSTNAGAITIREGTINMTDSTVTSNLAAASIYGAIYMMLNTSVITMNQSTVRMTSSGKCLQMSGAMTPNTAEFNNTTFKRINSGAGSGYCLGSADAANVLNSTSNGNLFCYENAALTFSAVQGGTTPAGSFVLANQQNGGAIGACP